MTIETKDNDVTKESLEHMFDLIKSTFLVKMLPNVALHYNLIREDIGFHIPVEFTALCFSYFTKWLMDIDTTFLLKYQCYLVYNRDKDKESNSSAPNTSNPSPSLQNNASSEKNAAITNNLKEIFNLEFNAQSKSLLPHLSPNNASQHMKNIISSSAVNISFFFELLRRTLLLPFSFAGMVHLAVGLVRTWMQNVR
jgi:hypothetical protein